MNSSLCGYPVRFHFLLVSALATSMLVGSCWSQQVDSLRAGFIDPPATARPRVFWHWMNGNISSEGVTLDLEWMKRVGLSGAFIVEVDLDTPVVVPRRQAFMSPEWQNTFRTAASTADRLGLSLGISTSSGWSDMGAPWVKPEQAMKKLVWSTTAVQGGQRPKLSQPPSVAGPFQDIPISAMVAGGLPMTQETSFYRDVAVLAYRTISGTSELIPSVFSNTGPVDLDLLTSGTFAKAQVFPLDPVSHAVWIRFDYSQAKEVSSVSVSLPGPRGFGAGLPPQAILEASDDGVTFFKAADILLGSGPEQTISFPTVRAKSFRVTFRAATDAGIPPAGAGVVPLPAPAPGTSVTVSGLRLYTEPRINHFEEKAGFSAAPDYDAIANLETQATSAVPARAVLDLTKSLRPDGTLDWTAPEGTWTVLRLGYSLTGKRNAPAAPDATGLEADKLSALHTREYLDTYLGMFAQAAGPTIFGRHGVRGILNDSIESGAQNWTEDMVIEFRQRRGYDPTPWLPALTGVIVESASASDLFLWDFRETIAALISDEHYGQLRKSADAYHLDVYGEALEDHRPQLGDDLAMRKYTTVPMGAMWTFPEGGAPRQTFVADDRGAASVAHLWGQNIAGAESMTSFGEPWNFAPRDLKHIADLEFALGINAFIIHSSVEQPLQDRKPGVALLPLLGQYFNRNETWAEEAGPWITYLARNTYLLQQGHFVADIAYFYGEEAPLTGLYGEASPSEMLQGYGFDFINGDALRNLLTVDRGELTTASGMCYRLLYLGGASSKMTVLTLKRVRELVLAGAILVGNAPSTTRSLADNEAEFRQIVAELWPSSASTRSGASVGQGRVFARSTPAEVLRELGVQPDVAFKGAVGTQPVFVHRSLKGAEIYYISNPSEKTIALKAVFRTAGMRPEIWHADTGVVSRVSYETQAGRTRVPLAMAANESLFVIFRGLSAPAFETVTPPPEKEMITLGGPWALSFEAGRGAPEGEVSTGTGSWSLSDDPGVRYFSGTGTYRKSLQLTSHQLTGHRIKLDLGDIRDLATVTINGKRFATLWHPPYEVDVTEALQVGSNEVQVEVTNLWINRLIGDQQTGVRQMVTLTTGPTYEQSAPLRVSGLLGPVRLIAVDGNATASRALPARSAGRTEQGKRLSQE